MKKKLEAELISIAHRILKLKNKSDLEVLHLETQKLYETLTVLKFAEKHFSDVKPTIGIQEIEEKLDEEQTVLDQIQEEVLIDDSVDATLSINETSAEAVQIEEAILEEEEPIHDLETEELIDEVVEVDEEENSEEIIENESEVENSEEESDTENEEEVLEESKPIFNPGFELSFEKVAAMEPETPSKEIVFEDIFGDHYKDLEFVKAESLEVAQDENKEEVLVNEMVEEVVETEEVVEMPETISFVTPEPILENVPAQTEEVKNTRAITFGLNDRIGFVSQLFDGSNEDFNRVLSQLNTFHKFEDAKNFIEDLVKPDYNDWSGKEDFEKRFYEVVENKFK